MEGNAALIVIILIRTFVPFIILVGLPKIAQEHVMHYKYPDQTWNFLRDHLFWWMY